MTLSQGRTETNDTQATIGPLAFQPDVCSSPSHGLDQAQSSHTPVRGRVMPQLEHCSP